MKKHFPAWLALCILALVAGGLLILVNVFVGADSEAAAKAAEKAAFLKVMPGAAAFSELKLEQGAEIDHCYTAVSNNQAMGYIAAATVTGYNGPIEVTVGVDLSGKITAVRVGGAGFNETPGLGAKTAEKAFTSQFAGLVDEAKLKGNVQAVTGATISSGAVTSGVNKAAAYVRQQVLGIGVEAAGPEDKMFGGLLPGATTKKEETAPAGIDAVWSSDAGAVVYASEKGYDDLIQVQVGVYNDGTIANVKITEEGFKETEGVGARVKDKAFLQKFQGLSGEVKAGSNVDTLSGATISSTAVVKAVNKALQAAKPFLDPTKAKPSGAASAESTLLPGATNVVAATTLPEGAEALWTADQGVIVQTSAQGRDDLIHVKVGVLKDGTIGGIEILKDNFHETEGIGTLVLEDSFQSQFAGKSGTLTIGQNIDAVSGATISSTAVVKAVNKALEIAKPLLNSAQANPSGTAPAASTPLPSTTPAKSKLLPGATNVVAVTTLPQGAEALWTADQGVIVQTSTKGRNDLIHVKVGVLKDGTIGGIEILKDNFRETEGIGTLVLEDSFQSQFAGKSGTLTIGKNIDAVSGATISSTAVVKAVNKALEIAKGLQG